jgi:hypothetical protein
MLISIAGLIQFESLVIHPVYITANRLTGYWNDVFVFGGIHVAAKDVAGIPYLFSKPISALLF